MVGMPFERFEKLAARQLENLDELIGPASCQLGAVGTEADAEDGVTVAAFDLGNQAARVDVEDFDLAVFGGSPAAGCKPFAVRREGQADHAIGKTTQPFPQSYVVMIPNDHLQK